MFTFLLVVHAIVAASLVAVILVQRSEGGGLGMGGSPSGLMSARGAADFLTRATAVLASIFVLMSIALAAYASVARAPSRIDTSLARRQTALPAAPIGAAGGASGDPLAAVPGPAGAPGVPPPLELPSTATPRDATPAADDHDTKRSDDSSRPKKSGEDRKASAAKTEGREPPPIETVPLRPTPKAGSLIPEAVPLRSLPKIEAPTDSATAPHETPKAGTIAPASPPPAAPPASSAPASPAPPPPTGNSPQP